MISEALIRKSDLHVITLQDEGWKWSAKENDPDKYVIENAEHPLTLDWQAHTEAYRQEHPAEIVTAEGTATVTLPVLQQRKLVFEGV